MIQFTRGGGDKDIVKQFFVVSDVIRMGTVPIQNDITDDKKKTITDDSTSLSFLANETKYLHACTLLNIELKKYILLKYLACVNRSELPAWLLHHYVGLKKWQAL